ncbi:MAG: type II toxin-antitoxin system HicB family antitoxin [Saprospiraceae bacterium]
MSKRTKRKFTFLLEKTKTGFSAYSEDIPVYTTGKTLTELNENILEAINFYFENDQIEITPSNIELQVDLKQFFGYYRVINAKFLAQRIGMNESLLSQYVKGKKKPSGKQVDKILAGINEIGTELSALTLVLRESSQPYKVKALKKQ